VPPVPPDPPLRPNRSRNPLMPLSSAPVFLAPYKTAAEPPPRMAPPPPSMMSEPKSKGFSLGLDEVKGGTVSRVMRIASGPTVILRLYYNRVQKCI